MLKELLQPILETNDKVLIFTQYRQMGDLMMEGLEQVLDSNRYFCVVVWRARNETIWSMLFKIMAITVCLFFH